jgi:hypothetical protein
MVKAGMDVDRDRGADRDEYGGRDGDGGASTKMKGKVLRMQLEMKMEVVC